MEWGMGRIKYRILAFIALISIAFGVKGIAASAETGIKEEMPVAAGKSGKTMPSNPVHHCTKENDGSDYTDWSYVYFGSYPQTEVTGSALTSAITGAFYDSNGDAWVDGVKYRRISKGDTNNGEYFGDSTYRYFKWERIKWRVLQNDGSTLFVVADKGLDCKDYHDEGGAITWENCTLRYWLNDSFYNDAFSSRERAAIVGQTVLNDDNPQYGTEGGNNTKDDVYLLSIGEVTNPTYGFCEDYSKYSASRYVETSDYTHMKGAYISASSSYLGNCLWWLRSPGHIMSSAVDVYGYGYVFRNGNNVSSSRDAVVPALYINLLPALWLTEDDGTSGDGGITPVAPTVSGLMPQNVKQGNSATFRVTASGGIPSNYTYQWYYATSQNGQGTRINGAISSSYSISSVTENMDGRYYYCTVSNGKYEVTSDKAKLTVKKESKPPVLKEQKITASSYTKTYGSKPFSLNARTNGDGKLTYRITNHSKAVTVSADGKVTVKGCGTAKIAIKASQIAGYKAASKTIIVKVVPRTPAMPQASSPSRRKMSIKWKQDKTVTAYELQISQKSNFKSQTIKRYYNYKKTKVSVTGFPSGRTYFVRMRCYKTLGKNKYYGNWSKVRKVKIK